MIRNSLTRITLAGLVCALSAVQGVSAPILKSEVVVTSAIVTVGDMFEGAGLAAERALFRAPAPGTTGMVNLAAVQTAASRAGIAEFQNPGVSQVRVERAGLAVTPEVLSGLIEADLRRRGIVNEGMTVQLRFDNLPDKLFAAPSQDPVRLLNLRHLPATNGFSASFSLEGFEAPIDITGQFDLMIEVPHLTGAQPAGTILGPDDVELRPVALRYAESGGIMSLEQVIGKQLRRSSRGDMILRQSDVDEPRLVGRNDTVTLYLRKGPMTLTVKGQALNNAAYGEHVSVLNTASKKIVQGVAVKPGTVLVDTGITNVADL